jgi:acetyltransferase-like isoleucine patch superfamily enzyme
MTPADSFILKVKRGETPFYAGLKDLAKTVRTARLPVPPVVFPVYRSLSHLGTLRYEALLRLKVFFYREPMFRSKCAHVGERLYLELTPSVSGHVKITVGDDVRISGALSISCGRVIDNPELVIGDRVFLGHNVVLGPNRRIEIEEDVLIAGACHISDSDDHPLDRATRIAGFPPPAERIKPILIKRGAWIGRAAYICKGVTIGQGSVVGAASVVTRDVPPFTVVAGNPARIIREIEPS